MGSDARISVIVPTINESERIRALISSLLDGGFHEIVVADGGSADDTCAIAERAGAVVIQSPPGRGVQLHAGAAQASGNSFFFLHADSELPNGARRAIVRALEQPGVVGGSFALAFDVRHWLLDLLAGLSRLNHALATYGDQGLFMRREIYAAIGGYEALPILEDLEIQRRLRRAGRFVKLPLAITTSSRRYMRDGIVRRQAANAWIVARYLAGEDPKRLARIYRPESDAGARS